MMRWIGIDPSFREGGFALCALSLFAGKITVSFRRFAKYIDFIEYMIEEKASRAQHVEIATVYCIEDSSMQNCTFDKSGNQAVAARKSRNVGMNQAASKLCGDIIERFAPDATLIRLSPLRKGQKMTAEEFGLHVKINGFHCTFIKANKSPNQDQRDAYKLAFHAKSRIK
jgi:hypothetical protein